MNCPEENQQAEIWVITSHVSLWKKQSGVFVSVVTALVILMFCQMSLSLCWKSPLKSTLFHDLTKIPKFSSLGDIYENTTPAELGKTPGKHMKNDETIYENPEPAKHVPKKVMFVLSGFQFT